MLSPFNCAGGDVDAFAATRWCAASPTAGTCAGDSGGPALVRRADGREVVVGTISFGVEQAPCASSVSVLTRVSAFRDWVRPLPARESVAGAAQPGGKWLGYRRTCMASAASANRRGRRQGRVMAAATRQRTNHRRGCWL